MIIVDLVQGSPEWHEHRAKYWNASDAPAMLDCSPYKTRAELIRELHGITKEVSPHLQKIFDDGHRVERLARELAVEILDEELFAQVGINGKYSASFDGLTVMQDIAFEHKKLNALLRDLMQGDYTCDDLPKYYRVQMEHQCMVGDLWKVLFMASDWNDNGELIEERHCWYYPDLVLRDEIVAGWIQFAEDVENYQHIEVAPKPTGKAPDQLPALFVEVKGMVTASNLTEFHSTAMTVFASINKKLETDNDFADAEKTVKWCEDVEKSLKAAKQHALAQTQSIDELFRTIDSIAAESARVRKDLEKLVKDRKDTIRREIQQDAAKRLAEHISEINEKIKPITLPLIATDFPGVMKGLKTFTSIRDKVESHLSAKKIEANQAHEHISVNMDFFNTVAWDSKHLFPDLQSLITKPQADLEAIIKVRISDAARAEEAKLLEQAKVAAMVEPVTEPEVTQAGIPLPKESDPAAASTATLVTPKTRPTDNQLIFAIATQFNVDFHTAMQWIKEINFSKMRGAA